MDPRLTLCRRGGRSEEEVIIELEPDGSAPACRSCSREFQKVGRVFSFISEGMYGNREEFEQASKVIDFWGSGWAKRLREPDHSYLFEADAGELKKLSQPNATFRGAAAT